MTLLDLYRRELERATECLELACWCESPALRREATRWVDEARESYYRALLGGRNG